MSWRLCIWRGIAAWASCGRESIGHNAIVVGLRILMSAFDAKFLYLVITFKMLLFFPKLCSSVCCDLLRAGLRCLQSGYAFDVMTY